MEQESKKNSALSDTSKTDTYRQSKLPDIKQGTPQFFDKSHDATLLDKNTTATTDNATLLDKNTTATTDTATLLDKNMTGDAATLLDKNTTTTTDNVTLLDKNIIAPTEATHQDLSNDSDITIRSRTSQTPLVEATLGLEYGVDLSNEEEPTKNLKPEPSKSARYSVIKEIGRGGMGRVVLWKDNNIHRLVASKLNLHKNSQETLQRFVEEGQITGQLEHPNIVPIHEMGLDESQNPYFTMKYVKGESLKSLIQRIVENPSLVEKEWPLTKRLQIFQQICYAVEYAHAKNVIHRDLKPENIMIGNFGEVMVMDWGLAKVVGQGHEILSEESVETLRTEGGFKTISGKIAGTPIYMSPEQASGNVEKIGKRSDIYSLGAILYEMLVGSNCLEKDQAVFTIILNVTNGKIKPVPAKSVLGVIPKELRYIVRKALKTSQEERYQSVHDLTQDIQRYMDGRDVQAYRYTIADRIVKLLKKYKKEVSIVVATGLVLLAVFFFVARIAVQKQGQECISAGNTEIAKASQNLDGLNDAFSKRFIQKESSYEAKLRLEEAKKKFVNIRESVLQGTYQYRKANECYPDYSIKQKETQGWFILFQAASLLGEHEIMETAQANIKSLLTPEDYEKLYKKQIEFGVSFRFQSTPPDAFVFLYRFEPVGKWFRLVPFVYDIREHRSKAYFCPLHPEMNSDKKGGCQCGKDYKPALFLCPNHPDVFSDQTGDVCHLCKTSLKKKSIPEPNPKAMVWKTPCTIWLPEGSYCVVYEKDRESPSSRIFYLLDVERNISDLLYPKSDDVAEIYLTLPVQDSIPSEFCYIPKTKFIEGGDAVGAYAEHVKEAEAFAIQKKEVTFREYIAFLEDAYQNIEKNKFPRLLKEMIDKQIECKATQDELYMTFFPVLFHLFPNQSLEKTLETLRNIVGAIATKQKISSKSLKIMENAQTKDILDGLLPKTFEIKLLHFENGKVELIEQCKELNLLWKADNWKDAPVSGIPKWACEWYALWYSIQKNRHYRLPLEQEWELAARGSDGRLFSWGHIYWAKAARMNAGYVAENNDPALEITRETDDVSPWGILDMCGSLGEWTKSVYEENSVKKTYTIKGNIWGLTPEGLKCAFRVGESYKYSHPTLGFRLVLDLSDK